MENLVRQLEQLIQGRQLAQCNMAEFLQLRVHVQQLLRQLMAAQVVRPHMTIIMILGTIPAICCHLLTLLLNANLWNNNIWDLRHYPLGQVLTHIPSTQLDHMAIKRDLTMYR